MNTSHYQLIKIHILSFSNLSKDAIHIHIGLIVLFISMLILRKYLGSLKALIPVLIVATAMEALDLRDDLNSLGRLRWTASLHDLVNTLFWPVVIVLMFKMRFIKAKFEQNPRMKSD